MELSENKKPFPVFTQGKSFICLQVFKELGIVETDEDNSEIIKINNIKNPLNASQFYNKLTVLKFGK